MTYEYTTIKAPTFLLAVGDIKKYFELGQNPNFFLWARKRGGMVKTYCCETIGPRFESG
jgi:hypothetical protein